MARRALWWMSVGVLFTLILMLSVGDGGDTSTAIASGLSLGTHYEDGFSRSGSGWDTGSGEASSAQYVDGEFSIQVHESNYYTGRLIPGDREFQEFCVATEIRRVGNDEGAYGILFGFEDFDNHYFLGLSTVSGRYRLDRRVNGSWGEMAEWKKMGKIRSGNATNRLKLSVDSSNTFKVYVNDSLIKTVLFESHYQGGEIALMAWAYDPGFTANFDYIRVMDPEDCNS